MFDRSVAKAQSVFPIFVNNWVILYNKMIRGDDLEIVYFIAEYDNIFWYKVGAQR